MDVSQQTLVHRAYLLCTAGPAHFVAHGVDPAQRCPVVWDVATLEDAQSGCGLRDVDRLVDELNALAALPAPESAASASDEPPPSPTR